MEDRAYVLIRTVIGKALDVSQTLCRHKWVESVERTTGAYDIMTVTRGGEGSITEGMIRDVIEQIDGVFGVVVCPLRTAARDIVPSLDQHETGSPIQQGQDHKSTIPITKNGRPRPCKLLLEVLTRFPVVGELH
jgi:hypothetical protein